jgi:hypothetical protein
MNIGFNIPSHPTLTQAANQVVNQVFWGTMLREFRSAHQDPILGHSPGAGVFLQQLDQVLLDRMGDQGESPLVKSLLKQLGARPQMQVGPGKIQLNAKEG